MLPVAQRADRDVEPPGEFGLRQAEAGAADQARALAAVRDVEILGVGRVSGQGDGLFLHRGCSFERR
ncbi:MAG: hypothetical protein U1E40_06370 [Amaricoccus sp.]